MAADGRWSYVSELDAETLARFNEIIAKANRIEAGIVKDDEWRDGMVEQVSGFMDKIKDMDAEEAEGADTVLAETFNSIDALSTDAAIDLLRVYSNCDASGRDAVAKTFYALSGESFDSYGYAYSDVMTGYRAMSKPFIKTFPVLSEGFQIETELSIHAVDHRWRILNIPIDYRDRPEGSVSKLNTVRMADGRPVTGIKTFSRCSQPQKSPPAWWTSEVSSFKRLANRRLLKSVNQ